jgi:hypothetical protein
LPATAAAASRQDSPLPPAGSIATYAGGLPGATAVANMPKLVGAPFALAGPGVIAVADAAHNVVWLANLSAWSITRYSRTIGAGRMAIVAGNGAGGFGGDGGPATHAMLNVPFGVAVDRAGDLYIADSLNNRVRKVQAGSGMITMVAGTGKEGFSGDDGPARKSTLNHPVSVAVDRAGNLYIADCNNGRVRVVYGVAVPLN